MDTKQLITFVTFAKEKSYTKSSMKLNYAVSTLSDHINSLESELGVKLVESHGKRTTLTKNGEVFLEYANKILQLYKEAQEAIAYLNSLQGNLKIVTSESVGLYGMAPVLAKFAKAFPNIELSVTISNPINTFFEKLESQEMDLLLCYGLKPVENNNLNVITLFQEDLVYVAYPKHPLAKKAAVLPSDFRSEAFLLPSTDCFYRQALKDMLAEHNVPLKTKMNLDSGSLIKNYVKKGFGISLLPYSVAREEIEKGELVMLQWKGPALHAIAQIITLKKEWLKPSIQEMVRFATAYFSES